MSLYLEFLGHFRFTKFLKFSKSHTIAIETTKHYFVK